MYEGKATLGNTQSIVRDACDEERKPKHIVLDDTINSLGYAVYELEELVRKITGESQPDCAKDGTSAIPDFLETLNRAPERIQNNTRKINELTAMIDNMLF